MFLGNDVVDRMGGPSHRLRNQAIFADLASSFPDLAAQCQRYVRCAHRGLLSCSPLEHLGFSKAHEMFNVLVVLPLP